MKYFQYISVWKTIDSTAAVRFVCFQDLEKQKFCVQSADFFHVPIDDKSLAQADKQIVELFVEVPPIDRCEWFSSLEDAIRSHELEFEI